MIDYYLDLIIVGAVCLFIGYRVADAIHKSVVADLLHRAGVTPEKMEEIMDDLRNEIKGVEVDDEDHFPEVSIRIEKHNDTLYAYRKDTEEFLGQGSTREALIERMGEKLANIKLVISQEDGAALLGHESFNYSAETKTLSVKDPTS